MSRFFFIFLMFILIAPTVSAESYIATRQELWFSDSSYYKTSHHIKIGKSINMNNYKVFGELGFGEDINEGTPVGSGASYDYLRFGFTKTFFDTLRVNVNYRSKMKSAGRDLNWIVINTKYKF
tara:strand:- start:187 stop:555 length:369 start_codon:yes stop_codon:yes gene_type:complete